MNTFFFYLLRMEELINGQDTINVPFKQFLPNPPTIIINKIKNTFKVVNGSTNHKSDSNVDSRVSFFRVVDAPIEACFLNFHYD